MTEVSDASHSGLDVSAVSLTDARFGEVVPRCARTTSPGSATAAEAVTAAT